MYKIQAQTKRKTDRQTQTATAKLSTENQEKFTSKKKGSNLKTRSKD